MLRKTLLKRIPIIALLLLFAVGCSSSTLKIGWRETSTLSHKAASFKSFSGGERYTICAREGDDLKVDYNLEIAMGNLGLTLEDPDDNIVWEDSFQDDVVSSYQLVNAQKGCYQLQVVGDQTEGGYEIAWSLER